MRYFRGIFIATRVVVLFHQNWPQLKDSKAQHDDSKTFNPGIIYFRRIFIAIKVVVLFHQNFSLKVCL